MVAPLEFININFILYAQEAGGILRNHDAVLLYKHYAGIAQFGRAEPCQGPGRGFESRFPLK